MPTSNQRPIFIHYENSRPGELRPFHHAYLVVGRAGGGDTLDKNNKVIIFDRYGGKPDQLLCEMVGEPEVRMYHKLPLGWYKHLGWTAASNDEILAAGKAEVDANPPYGALLNNCESFATALGWRILAEKNESFWNLTALNDQYLLNWLELGR
ncbi:hypothetical protein FB451DRAFT_1259323 [Mycena latifolia]|nr:hypothetical protein FB451DRAFT_1259323 [Mycena latifolia]